MTFTAYTATALFRGVFYHFFMGFILIVDILSFMTAYTADFSVHGLNEVFGNTKSIPTPHLRG